MDSFKIRKNVVFNITNYGGYIIKHHLGFFPSIKKKCLLLMFS